MVIIHHQQSIHLVQILTSKKNNMKKFIYTLILIFPLVLVSCSKDFLNRPPEDAYVVDNFFVSADNLRIGTGALYNIPWFDYNDKSGFSIGDGSSGGFLSNDGAMNQFYQFSLTGSNARLAEAWRSLYVVIGQANSIIQGIDEKAGPNISNEDKNAAKAEAKFMRAVAYQYLALLWGPVPIIENNSKLITNPKLPRNKVADVFQFVINDLNFAVDNLPATDEPGRVTSWSAKAMLARTYLYRAGLGGTRNAADIEMAKNLASDVVKNSGLELMEKYEDLFVIKNNNNPESLFALQWVTVADQWGCQNTHQAYFAAEGKITGVGDGWGGGNGAAPNLQALYDSQDLRRKATFMYKGDVYPELNKKSGGYQYDVESSAGSAIKKYVIGNPDDNDGQVAFMRTSLNTYMMRLSEVYLIYAEALMGAATQTSDPDALLYFNKVRNRAGLPNDADGTITWMEIFNEKRVELAMEGQNWFDVVRWSYFAQTDVLNYLSTQEKGNYRWENGVKIVNPQLYPVTAANLVFPYPEADVTANPLLKEEPVDYKFN